MSGAVIAITGAQISHRLSANLINLAAIVAFSGVIFLVNGETNIAVTGLFAVLCSCALLLTMGSTISNILFANRAMVWIGQRSYSIYLVHWPLVVFYVFQHGSEISFGGKLLLGFISIVLGAFLRKLVEQPFRVVKGRKSWLDSSATATSTALLAITVAFSSMTWFFQGFPGRINVDIASLLQEDVHFGEKMRRGTCFLGEAYNLGDLAEECYVSTPAEKSALIIGSSLAADRYHGIMHSMKDWEVYQITSSSCMPFIKQSKKKFCLEMQTFIYDIALKQYQYDLVILGGIGTGKVGARLSELVQYFESNNIDFVVVGPRPRFTESPRVLINRHGEMAGLDSFMRDNIRGPKEIGFNFIDKNYFSQNEALCPIPGDCIWRDKGTILYRDKLHFTVRGSEIVGQKFADWVRGSRDMQGFSQSN